MNPNHFFIRPWLPGIKMSPIEWDAVKRTTLQLYTARFQGKAATRESEISKCVMHSLNACFVRLCAVKQKCCAEYSVSESNKSAVQNTQPVNVIQFLENIVNDMSPDM